MGGSLFCFIYLLKINQIILAGLGRCQNGNHGFHWPDLTRQNGNDATRLIDKADAPSVVVIIPAENHAQGIFEAARVKAAFANGRFGDLIERIIQVFHLFFELNRLLSSS